MLYLCRKYILKIFIMDSSVLLVYENDGSKIVNTVRKRLEQCDITVYTAKISQIIDPPPYSAVVLFLTPGMLSILKSSCSPDLKLASKICAVFFHNIVNISGKSIQEILCRKLPYFSDWKVYPLVKKVQTLTLQILQLIDTENEETDPDFCLVSEFQLYPDNAWKQNQDVFISFVSERHVEDNVMVETDNRLFEVTWLNPYTSTFRFADNRGGGKRTVTVHVNQVPVGTIQVVIKDRDQILLDDINDVGSPLHYLKEILNMTQGREEELQSEMADSLILEGTRKLLKRLHEKSIISTRSIIEPQDSQDKQEEDKSTEEGDVIFRRRPTRQAFKRKSSSKSHSDSRIGEEEHRAREERQRRKSQRISRALQNLSMKEDFPSIDFDEELLKSLPSDFFDKLCTEVI